MKQLLLITAATIGLTVTLALIPHPTETPKTPHPHRAAKVIFFDDFNTGHLDRSKWNVETTGNHYNDELEAYVDSAKTLYEENGNLVI
ncbi:MAG TPA: hypothetical protein VHW43_04980, partial [Puia sp.]|nr:hypothetical protein [Puia sp.]